MQKKQMLLDNIDKIHTTKTGAGRIKKNFKSGTDDVVGYYKNRVLDKNAEVHFENKGNGTKWRKKIMASYECCECGVDMELDLDEKMLRCPNCGCESSIDDDEIARYEGDYYSSECLPVDEAALIWASHGKDEDYMCGYSEYELEDAL
ncbi:DUF3781 domain-containing protein [Roseburia hominis]